MSEAGLHVLARSRGPGGVLHEGGDASGQASGLRAKACAIVARPCVLDTTVNCQTSSYSVVGRHAQHLFGKSIIFVYLEVSR